MAVKHTHAKPVDVILPDTARDALHGGDMSEQQTIEEVKLGDDIKDRLRAHADNARAQWIETCCIFGELIKPGVKKDALYSAIAQELDLAATTVTQWVNIFERVEDLIPDYQFYGFTHWRAIASLAKRNNRTMKEEAEYWTSTEAKYSGRPVTVDKLRAALADPDGAQTLDASKSAKTLGRLGRAVAAHDKALGVGDAGVQAGQREAWAVVRAAVEDYAGKYGG